MKSMRNLVGAFLLLFGCVGAMGEDTPPWEYEIEESAVATFEAPVWLERDFGWLFTCRVSVSSRHAIRPIVHMRFEGLDAEGEPVWNESKVIRRADFKSQFGGGDQVFVRMVAKDVPPEVKSIVIRFDDGRGESEASE